MITPNWNKSKEMLGSDHFEMPGVVYLRESDQNMVVIADDGDRPLEPLDTNASTKIKARPKNEIAKTTTYADACKVKVGCETGEDEYNLEQLPATEI
ncbi:unnamed protein product [Ambrosiozyma monospora]|uniref:Unnamed protein product n=1 Tax=Ambrosiozyma monospora TaxID=43982 RepID=A0A9W7DJS7_AMBMO|nr:unnamed protein product [Ambrosiozyma monospora]